MAPCCGPIPWFESACLLDLYCPHYCAHPQYGFNPGSHLAIHSHSLSEGVARTAVTTTLAAGSGAIATLALTWHRTRCLDLLQVSWFCWGFDIGRVMVH